eukprot:scpid55146/ scgid12740/ 
MVSVASPTGTGRAGGASPFPVASSAASANSDGRGVPEGSGSGSGVTLNGRCLPHSACSMIQRTGVGPAYPEYTWYTGRSQRALSFQTGLSAACYCDREGNRLKLKSEAPRSFHFQASPNRVEVQ